MYKSFSIKSKGFTLIEILIALFILSISLLGLAGLMVKTTNNNSYGAHITEAVTFAQDKMEGLKATQWDNILKGEDNILGCTGINYIRNWDVSINGSLKTITIKINWNDKFDHSISLLSVISQ
jgi:prepilin-type N-terminal cleavage/methylation domain-containing protein